MASFVSSCVEVVCVTRLFLCACSLCHFYFSASGLALMGFHDLQNLSRGFSRIHSNASHIKKAIAVDLELTYGTRL